jgi:oxygen-independent coproporphyrinogen-3 oxidase
MARVRYKRNPEKTKAMVVWVAMPRSRAAQCDIVRAIAHRQRSVKLGVRNVACRYSMLSNPPLSLYIHIPWCLRKCPYCDFNSHGQPTALPEADYVTALLADLDRELARVPGRPIETVFIGGGTPSLFSPEAIDRLLNGLGDRATFSADAEITLEANPGTVEVTRFKGFRAAGVNRLSIGIQSFDDAMLQALGRVHDSGDALRAVHTAREAGFDNLNLDLMFGLPNQGVEAALSDVSTAVALAPDHLSWYQLTLEPGTAFFKQPPVLPDDDITWQVQQHCQQALGAAGYRQYEVSAYARDGFRCRHNLNYWTFGDYLGIGAGAHGKFTDARTGRLTRTAKVKSPDAYLGVRPSAEPFESLDEISRDDLPLEFLMNQLRLRHGFSEADFPTRTGLPIGALEPALSACVRDGLLERSDGVIRCSDQGWHFLVDVLGRFVH